VAGGIDVPQVLGSRSTALRGFGGLEGRPLQRGDVLACGPGRARRCRPRGSALSRRKWP
jgi:allophanate hydrolase subunit 2